MTLLLGALCLGGCPQELNSTDIVEATLRDFCNARKACDSFTSIENCMIGYRPPANPAEGSAETCERPWLDSLACFTVLSCDEYGSGPLSGTIPDNACANAVAERMDICGG